ncbi:iron-sulfur cluster insertion protein ErpA [Methylosinus sp. Ce-a6]|uniref:iron-sulfur cluster insertion protein ErpA n=1 Tax=Methylosinus sp. Ce-a6 TaxID=2172005 RepID=UPI00135703C1|nr:iron-sulfur cluster insertion protein ErpA [Methylosinus sp. Ce-a6]
MSDTGTIAKMEMSERAAKRILAILAGEAAGAALRLAVDGGGCSGLQYAYTVEAEPKADDIVVERDGAKLVVDPVSSAYIAGARIDYVEDLMGQSFRVENPNATASCGCGSSFSV